MVLKEYRRSIGISIKAVRNDRSFFASIFGAAVSLYITAAITRQKPNEGRNRKRSPKGAPTLNSIFETGTSVIINNKIPNAFINEISDTTCCILFLALIRNSIIVYINKKV